MLIEELLKVAASNKFVIEPVKPFADEVIRQISRELAGNLAEQSNSHAFELFRKFYAFYSPEILQGIVYALLSNENFENISPSHAYFDSLLDILEKSITFTASWSPLSTYIPFLPANSSRVNDSRSVHVNGQMFEKLVLLSKLDKSSKFDNMVLGVLMEFVSTYPAQNIPHLSSERQSVRETQAKVAPDILTVFDESYFVFCI